MTDWMNDLILFIGRNIKVWKNMYKDNELLNEVLTSLLDAVFILSTHYWACTHRIVGFHRK